MIVVAAIVLGTVATIVGVILAWHFIVPRIFLASFGALGTLVLLGAGVGMYFSAPDVRAEGAAVGGVFVLALSFLPVIGLGLGVYRRRNPDGVERLGETMKPGIRREIHTYLHRPLGRAEFIGIAQFLLLLAVLRACASN